MSAESIGQVVEIKTRRCKGEGFKHGPFLVDEKLQTVECGACGGIFNASYVLAEIGRWEYRMHEKLKQYKKEAEEAVGRNRTKCEHCEKMTRIVK